MVWYVKRCDIRYFMIHIISYGMVYQTKWYFTIFDSYTVISYMILAFTYLTSYCLILQIRDSDWRIAGTPQDLQDRRSGDHGSSWSKNGHQRALEFGCSHRSWPISRTAIHQPLAKSKWTVNAIWWTPFDEIFNTWIRKRTKNVSKLSRQDRGVVGTSTRLALTRKTRSGATEGGRSRNTWSRFPDHYSISDCTFFTTLASWSLENRLLTFICRKCKVTRRPRCGTTYSYTLKNNWVFRKARSRLPFWSNIFWLHSRLTKFCMHSKTTSSVWIADVGITFSVTSRFSEIIRNISCQIDRWLRWKYSMMRELQQVHYSSLPQVRNRRRVPHCCAQYRICIWKSHWSVWYQSQQNLRPQRQAVSFWPNVWHVFLSPKYIFLVKKVLFWW